VRIRDAIVSFAGWLVATLPALWLLTHPVPVAWLVPFAREPNAPNDGVMHFWPNPVVMHFWPILLSCLVPSFLAYRDWKWRRQVTFGWIALLFCALQAYCFNTATHPALFPVVDWGLLPSLDSQHYLDGAVGIAEGVGIRSPFGARQMWLGFLALLHTWCHGDLKLMLSLLTLMQAAIAFTTWEMVCATLGRGGAFIWLSSVILFCRTYISGTLMSEQLGLPLAMLAAVTLLYGWQRRALVPWLLGLLLLTCALNARPGCYFVAALLVASTFWRFRHTAPAADARRKFFSDLAWYRGTIAIGLVSLCMAANALSYRHLVTPPRMPSTFWLVLYGIAKGDTWLASIRDLGGELYSYQISTVSEEERWCDLVSRTKQTAIKEIAANPQMLLHSGWRVWREVVTKQTFFAEKAAPWWGILLLSMSAMALALAGLKNTIALENGAFFWLVWIGVFLSLPLVPPWDGGARIYAATAPLIWLTPAAFCSWCGKRLSSIWAKERHAKLSAAACLQNGVRASLRRNSTAGALLVISSIFLPSVLLAVNRNKAMPRYSDLMPLGKTSMAIKEIPGSLIRRNRGIIVGSTKSRTFLPRLARDDFNRGLPGRREFPIGEFMKELPDNSYIALLGRPRYLICDHSAFQNGSAIARIPLQDADWMAYKYVISLSKSVVLTARQVMILCPASAGHEIFWKPAVPVTGQ
jgi:hypothetical protein